MSLRAWTATGVGSLIVLGALLLLWPAPTERAAGPMPHEVYVWQRSWTPEVATSVSEAAPLARRIVVLGAEVGWEKGRPSVVRVDVDYDTLRDSRTSVGLALRIGPYSGPFDTAGETVNLLADLAAALVRQAETAGVRPSELQIDFDCAASKLAGYRIWVESIRQRIEGVDVTITALPSWMNRLEFGPLVKAADGFILQVHSLERPESPEKIPPLCDPVKARRWVEKAGAFGVPFRVALPTYGYIIAFDAAGGFVGLLAEGPSPSWPEGTRLRSLRTDAGAMAELVAGWTKDRPEALRGVIWYRLGIPSDNLNWRWETLSAIMRGRTPKADLQIETSKDQGGLTEVYLVNTGDADAPPPPVVALRWRGSDPIAFDAIGGFAILQHEPGEIKLAPSSQFSLSPVRPHQRRMIAWVRFGTDTEVHVYVSTTQP